MLKTFISKRAAGWIGVLLSFHAFAQETIVVDEADADFEGRWQKIEEKKGYANGPTFKYAMMAQANEPSSTVTFRPDVPADGRYHVEVYSSPGRNRFPKVSCVISGSEGKTTVTVDQTTSPAGWRRVAENVLFSAGSRGFIQLGNNCDKLDSVDKIVIADAVRLIRAADGPAGFELITLADGQGVIKRTPGKMRYQRNIPVMLTAEPEEGHIFNGWSGDVTSMDNPVYLSMGSDKKVSARFVPGGTGDIMEATEATFEGAWLRHTAKGGWARTDYTFASSAKKNASATYRPLIPKHGRYDVYIWYTPGKDRASDVSWQITSGSGNSTITVDQQKNAGDWFQIGENLEFLAGTNGYVRLSNRTKNEGSVVVADAVAFVYIGPP